MREVRDRASKAGLQILTERTARYEISWMRAGDGRHHTIVAVKGESGVHHISWEFNPFQNFRGLSDNLSVEDRRLVWGPGRGTTSSSITAIPQGSSSNASPRWK